MSAIPFAKSFGACSTGGRFGFSFHNNRNFRDTFSNIRPEAGCGGGMHLQDNERLQTTTRVGVLHGLGGCKDARSTRSFRKYHNEDRVLREYDRLDQEQEDRKTNRIKNIYNRRMLYVNTLHHDPRN